MSGARLVQNFRGIRALFVHADDSSVEAVATTLKKLGAVVSLACPADLPLDPTALAARFDILLFDLDLGIPDSFNWARLAEIPPIPIIGIIGVEAPSQLKALMQLGVTAWLRKPVQGASVYAALYIGINEFNRRRFTEERLRASEQRRRGRRFVIKAVVQVMKLRGVNDDEAFQILRRESMKQQLSVEAFSEQIVRNALQEAITGANAEER